MAVFAKFLFFLVFIVFATGALTFPSADHDHDSSEEHHHKGDKHNHGKGHKHEKNNEHHHHHSEGPYDGNMDVKINPASPFMKVKNLTEDLYTEIFVIASGDNYKSPEVPNDVHVNARVLVLLSQTLRGMLRIYPFFFNSTMKYASKGVKVEDKETMVNVINDLVAKVNESSSSGPSFETLKSTVTDSFIMRGKYFKSEATPQEKNDAYEKWLWDPFVGAAAMNRLFYRAVWKNDKPPYKILRAMVDIGRYEKDEGKLEKIYTTAIAKTVEKVCPAHDNRRAAFIFYQNLMDLLSEDASSMMSLYNDKEMLPGSMFDKPF